MHLFLLMKQNMFKTDLLNNPFFLLKNYIFIEYNYLGELT